MKDAYYFSHDSNAKDDPKCVLLIEQLGLEGYGIFWVLIETIRDQPNYKYPVALIPALARRYNTTAEKMRTVVNSYGLFVVDENEFFSLSLIERMEKLDCKREQARKAGKISAQKRLMLNGGSTDVQQTFNGSSTSKVKKSKVKEKKVNESRTEILLADYTGNTELIKAIKEFITMRVSIKKPMTERAVELMLDNLDKLGSNDVEKIEILNQSIMNCWQGLFPLKQSGQTKNNNTVNEVNKFFDRSEWFYDDNQRPDTETTENGEDITTIDISLP